MELVADALPRLGMLAANQRLHHLLLHAVLFAPLAFTDTTPSGRILSRFSKDLDVLDNQMLWDICDSVFCAFDVCFLTLLTNLRLLIIVGVRLYSGLILLN